MRFIFDRLGKGLIMQKTLEGIKNSRFVVLSLKGTTVIKET